MAIASENSVELGQPGPGQPSPALARLNRQHGQLLSVHESFVAACQAGPHDRVRPSTVFGVFGAFGRRMHQSLGEDEMKMRQSQVNLFLHRRGLHVVPFVDTKVGFTIALTEHRIIVFDENCKKYLTQSPLKGVRLERVDHNDGSNTLLFCEHRACTAVHAWDDAEIVDEFVHRFHQIRTQRLSG